MKNKIICVIPVYNEEKTIKDIIKNTKKYCDEILVVCAKKSNDNTLSIVEALNIKHIKDNGKGKGDAIRCAINHIKGQNIIIVFIDADGSHDPKDIPKLLNPILKNKADLVIGSRMKGGSDELYGSLSEFVRLICSCIITLIINYRFGVRFTDYQNGFRAIKLNVAKKLKLNSDITTIEQEMAIKCLKKHYKVVEVPIHEYKRKYGKSTFSVWKVGYKYFFNLIKNIL